jgi:protein-disulfide isomerase
MQRSAVLALVVLASCASRQHLDTIDRRLSDIEEQEADTHKQLDRMQAAIAQLGVQLADARTRAAADEIAARLDTLTKEVAALEAKGAPRPPVVRPGPDPKDVYAIAADGFPADGPPDALVTIVRAYDFACPFCERSRATMQELRARYGSDLRIVYRSFIVHPAQATLPAEAACAAHKQGKFLEMERRLWDEAFVSRTFDQAEMEKIAGEVGLKLDRFRADMSGPCVSEVGADQLDLTRFGVGATPTFYINGHYMAGAQPAAAFEQVIDDELALAKSRIGNGGKVARKSYYATWIIAKGLTQLMPPTTP